MATTVGYLLSQHPTNPVDDPRYETDTKKGWAKRFEPISRVKVHTSVQDGIVLADFDSALGREQADDTVRQQLGAYPPNYRHWRLETESDAKNWFHHEISSVVLAAWAQHPNVIQQSEAKAFSDSTIAEVADDAYTIKPASQMRTPLVIGEFKRGLIQPPQWQRGDIDTSRQLTLSRELRGYAHKYECPQIFCFDGRTLLMLQFRARKLKHVAEADCEVDCWVIPRENEGGCTLRYALYRLLVQGLRRCQGKLALSNVTLYGQSPKFRQFYSGEPIWDVEGKLYRQPWDCYRVIDPSNGAFYWMCREEEVQDQDGNRMWDTQGIYKAPS
ncbi:Uncharacterized protein TPAR_05929 [Tolypocladium paradoxum]|uniref:Uncharacterized protein n=1 Tax=Tolypocladium paradoxum TaxID=94208 RepID=A0A2S4KUL2_9HYPO|nr:Uncharacterized protein TPAR_05929 [Tolypocladium paradoxum]